ncbi:MAG: hypothetical protein D6784_05570 [Chloroflexi bacterium]|nr:MAG: hypothetical protein D6784_05570 [Chloroflexota bacterium]
MNKGELLHLVVGTILIVLFFIAFESIFSSTQASTYKGYLYQLDLYADHHSASSHNVYLPAVFR